jgi:hypothetical protein
MLCAGTLCRKRSRSAAVSDSTQMCGAADQVGSCATHDPQQGRALARCVVGCLQGKNLRQQLQAAAELTGCGSSAAVNQPRVCCRKRPHIAASWQCCYVCDCCMLPAPTGGAANAVCCQCGMPVSCAVCAGSTLHLCAASALSCVTNRGAAKGAHTLRCAGSVLNCARHAESVGAPRQQHVSMPLHLRTESSRHPIVFRVYLFCLFAPSSRQQPTHNPHSLLV